MHMHRRNIIFSVRLVLVANAPIHKHNSDLSARRVVVVFVVFVVVAAVAVAVAVAVLVAAVVAQATVHKYDSDFST